MFRIGLISDVHATPGPVEEALTLFQKKGVQITICAGDIAGYGDELDQTVELLLKGKCQVISGNHDKWFLNKPVASEQQWIQKYFATLPSTLDFTLEDKNIYVVHASPPGSNMKGIKLLDEQGEIIPERKQQWTKSLQRFNYDVLVVGHTHQVFSERLANMLVINPGSTKFNHSCAVLTLPDLDVEILPLSGKTLSKVWNWSQMERMYEEGN